MVAPIHYFDPKWVKKGLAPLKNASEWPICVLPAYKKILFPHIARRINEAAMGRAGAEYLIFHSLCGPVDRKKPITQKARV
jgi:hypothetical protein